MSDYDRWQTRFSADHYVFGTEPNAFLKRQGPRLKPGMKVLSIADGEGRNGVWLGEQGLIVTAQDFSPRAQQKARALAEKRGVSLKFELRDIRQFDWPDAGFDAVVGIFFQFLTPEERLEIFAAMQNAVKPGGLILIEGYGERQLEFGTGGPKVLDQLYTTDLLANAFADCEILELRSYQAEIDEGPGHSGMSALVDIVARRGDA